MTRYFIYYVDITVDGEPYSAAYNPNNWRTERGNGVIEICENAGDGDKIVWQMTDNGQSDEYAIRQAIAATVCDYVRSNA